MPSVSQININLNPELSGASVGSETTHWGSCAASWPQPSSRSAWCSRHTWAGGSGWTGPGGRHLDKHVTNICQDESEDKIVCLTFSFQSNFITDRVWAKNTVDLFSHEVFVIDLSCHKKILRTI